MGIVAEMKKYTNEYKLTCYLLLITHYSPILVIFELLNILNYLTDILTQSNLQKSANSHRDTKVSEIW